MSRDTFLTVSYKGEYIHQCYDRTKSCFLYTSSITGRKEYRTLKYLKRLVRKHVEAKGRTCSECGSKLLRGECYKVGCKNGI